MNRPTHIFFDVNETLIDITPLRQRVAQRLGGGAGQGDRWFNGLIEYSLAETLVGEPADFSTIAAAVLAMQVAENGGSLTFEESQGIVTDGLEQSNPFADVRPGLEKLDDDGFTLVALTNSGEDGLRERLENASIAQYFDWALSVQPSGAYKPDRRCYEYGLSEAGANAASSMMVACHPWDLMGAQAAGMQTAFVERPGKAWYPLADEPTLTVADVEQLAQRLNEIKDRA